MRSRKLCGRICLQKRLRPRRRGALSTLRTMGEDFSSDLRPETRQQVELNRLRADSKEQNAGPVVPTLVRRRRAA